jgi:uptake hydrogenase large subunit
MSLEGELLVRVAWDGHGVLDARVASTRPFAAARVLEGKTPAEVAATVPLLFGICSCAQGAAAAHALAGAGARIDDATAQMDVVLETMQEYFRRLLIDGPQTMHHAIDAASVADVRRRIATRSSERDEKRVRESPAVGSELASALRGTAARTIYGMSPSAWLKLGDADELRAWADRGATIPARLLGLLLDTMPALGCSDVAVMPFPARGALMRTVVPAMAREPEFSNAPTWDGLPVETGALARMQTHPLVAALDALEGNSVATRMTARLAELATLLVELDAPPMDDRSASWVQTMSLARDEGLGAVQTARGLLLHRACLADGRVARYQIVAPTDWNFHPDGALVRGLRGIVTDDGATLEQRVRLAVQALDPCVAFRIEVGHA